MPAHERASAWLRSIPGVSGPSDEAVVDAYAANLHLDPEQMHRMATQDPEQLADADLIDLGFTRDEAVDVAREIRRGLGPAYRRALASARPSHSSVVSLASRRTGTRTRGAGRPAARRTQAASSSSSGDDGSGSADPEPPSHPARRWALSSLSALPEATSIAIRSITANCGVSVCAVRSRTQAFVPESGTFCSTTIVLMVVQKAQRRSPRRTPGADVTDRRRYVDLVALV